MQEGIGCCGEVQIQTKSAGRRRRHSQYVTTFNQADVTIMIISRTTIEKLKSKTKKQQQSSWRTQESLLRAVKGTAVQCTNALQAGRQACLTMLVCKAVNPTVSPTNWPLFKWTRKVLLEKYIRLRLGIFFFPNIYELNHRDSIFKDMLWKFIFSLLPLRGKRYNEWAWWHYGETSGPRRWQKALLFGRGWG